MKKKQQADKDTARLTTPDYGNPETEQRIVVCYDADTGALIDVQVPQKGIEIAKDSKGRQIVVRKIVKRGA